MCLNFWSIRKKWPEQKAVNIATMDKKRELNPKRSFLGKSILKSLASFRDVSIERNIMSAVTEKQRPITEDIANASNAGLPSNAGSPVSLLVPPGTVLDVAKETPARSAATTEQDSEVSLSHSLPSFTSDSYDVLNNSPAVWSNLFVLTVKCSGTSPLVYCSMVQNYRVKLYQINRNFISEIISIFKVSLIK
jgi:hypothetical protein